MSWQVRQQEEAGDAGEAAGEACEEAGLWSGEKTYIEIILIVGPVNNLSYDIISCKWAAPCAVAEDGVGETKTQKLTFLCWSTFNMNSFCESNIIFQSYVDDQLISTNMIKNAVIAGHDGNIWATSTDFGVSDKKCIFKNYWLWDK